MTFIFKPVIEVTNETTTWHSSQKLPNYLFIFDADERNPGSTSLLVSGCTHLVHPRCAQSHPP